VAASAILSPTATASSRRALLKLGMIWQWKAQKGSPYAEDMGTYGDALTIAMGNDSPSPIIVGPPTPLRTPGFLSVAGADAMSRRIRRSAAPVDPQIAQQLQAINMPAPTRGIIQNENEAFMQPGGALVCDNWMPTMRGLKLRGGSSALVRAAGDDAYHLRF
jgi:hypothetical protein